MTQSSSRLEDPRILFSRLADIHEILSSKLALFYSNKACGQTGLLKLAGLLKPCSPNRASQQEAWHLSGESEESGSLLESVPQSSSDDKLRSLSLKLLLPSSTLAGVSDLVAPHSSRRLFQVHSMAFIGRSSRIIRRLLATETVFNKHCLSIWINSISFSIRFNGFQRKRVELLISNYW